MSETKQPEMMNVEEAGAMLLDSVDAPVFFNKLAQLGHAPKSEEEAVEMLKLGIRLQAMAPQLQKKAASTSLASRANQALDSACAKHGIEDPYLKQAEQQKGQQYLDLAVQAVQQRPELYWAELSCKAAEASLYAQEIKAEQKGQQAA